MELIKCEGPYVLARGRHGLFLANTLDFYVGRAISTYGEYGEIEWQLIDQLMRPGMDSVEVGANIGTHSVAMARKLAQWGRRLLVVEPQPVIFQNLCANIALNGFFNVQAENVACSDQAGTLSFSEPDYGEENNFGGVQMAEYSGSGPRVRAVLLDDLLGPDWDVGLIKIDVEGYEQRVLEGARDVIKRSRPILYLENDRVDKSKSLIEWLWSAGYRIWWHIPLLFNPKNFAGVEENLYGNVASFNMLAVPEEFNTSIDGLPLVEDSSFHPLRQVVR